MSSQGHVFTHCQWSSNEMKLGQIWKKTSCSQTGSAWCSWVSLVTGCNLNLSWQESPALLLLFYYSAILSPMLLFCFLEIYLLYNPRYYPTNTLLFSNALLQAEIYSMISTISTISTDGRKITHYSICHYIVLAERYKVCIAKALEPEQQSPLHGSAETGGWTGKGKQHHCLAFYPALL